MSQCACVCVNVYGSGRPAVLGPTYTLCSRAQVRAALGVRQTIVSGGGSLGAHLDLFFEQLGLTVINGYGLSETSPVVACRE